MHQHLGILQSFGVLFQIDLDEMSVTVDLLQRSAGLIVVAVSHLFHRQLRHGVDELGIKIALIARIGLLSALFELVEGLGVGKRFVDGSMNRGSKKKKEGRGDEKSGKICYRSHNAPRRERL